jgi:Protein of unknown function (DUF4031)
VILVDPIRSYPSGYWCHMVTDSSPEELHGFARRLGLRKERFQEHGRLPHYDLRPEVRERALGMGAEAVSSKELFRRGRAAILGAAGHPLSARSETSSSAPPERP